MKTLLVTGGSRGIGRAVAVMAAGRGWNVAINYVGNHEAAAETLEAIRAASLAAPHCALLGRSDYRAGLGSLAPAGLLSGRCGPL